MSLIAEPGLSPRTTPSRFEEYEESVEEALQFYANVHRGSGHKSMVSTALLEQARSIILDHFGWNDGKHTVVFCTPLAAADLTKGIHPTRYRLVSSAEVGLPLGLRALAVETRALPPGPPAVSGGGTVKFVLPGRVIWADAPDRFEAGTPSIISAVTLAKAVQKRKTPDRPAQPSQERIDRTADEILYHDELTGYTGWDLLSRLRQAVMGRHLLVPTREGPQHYINLDNAATTPALAPIWNTVRQTLRQPEAVQREIVERVRELVSELLGAPLDEYDILFLGNATEAINVAARSFGRTEAHAKSAVLTTMAEHHSNDLPWRFVPGLENLRLPADDEGFVDLRCLEGFLEDRNGNPAREAGRIRMVAVSGASNVTGAIDDIGAISRLAHRYGAQLLVDAAQLVAHRRIDMAESAIDYLAFSAHKMYAPFGSGALIARKGLLSFDAPEWDAIRASGEENVAGIAALGKAIVLLQRVGLHVIEEHERTLTRRLLEGLALIHRVRTYGVRDTLSARFRDKGAVISFSLTHVPHNRVAQELAEEGGIGVRHGCFCAHILVRHLLRIPPLLAKGAELGMVLFPRFMSGLLPGMVRISLGLENDESDVEHLLRTLQRIAGRPHTPLERLAASLQAGLPFRSSTERQTGMAAFGTEAVRRFYSLPYRLTSMSNLTFRMMQGVMSVWDLFLRHPKKELQQVPLRRGFTVVDYACGPGHYTIPMAEQVGPDGLVYAVDIQPMAMETIQRKAARKGLKNIRTLLVDSYDTGLPSANADIVLFLDAFHMIEDPDVLLREIQRLLKPKGLLFMDSGHLETSTALRQIENTDLFSLYKIEGNKIFLRKRA